ncbi:hypothetical protein [Lactobacillus terrae]|uniref:hypothetical protein n=1 Tax=Lactobacillus terrae TaxID=2269374 RepID=UPI000C1B7AF9|nr:hypothetical protein [Lactobacillus terrae]
MMTRKFIEHKDTALKLLDQLYDSIADNSDNNVVFKNLIEDASVKIENNESSANIIIKKLLNDLKALENNEHFAINEKSSYYLDKLNKLASKEKVSILIQSIFSDIS